MERQPSASDVRNAEVIRVVRASFDSLG
jgi:hypothetical protein